ncbi:hypothetical protein ACFWNR_30605 [Streptomyces virginiae]|uniref:hypothetical protein n=1 Tax=Streptomyces virginiae TaxID=1961 RepID=UPI0036517F9F
MACGIARLLDGIEFLRLTGIRGVTAGALAAVAVPPYFVHSGPPPAGHVLARILLNLLTCAALLVFVAGLRHLIRGAGPAFDGPAGPRAAARPA